MIFERGFFTSNITDSVITEKYDFARQQRTLPPGKVSIFLSHKHSDVNEVKGVVQFLQSKNIFVYIDRMDNTLPNQTSGETAIRIKNAIKKTNKFILLATHAAIESFWCNWELGIGDGFKFIDNIALIPIKERGQNDNQYKGNEYLQIYPSIQEGINDYLVKYPNGKVYYLNNWLKL